MPKRLHEGERDGAVAGVLGDLLLPRLAFLGQPLERRDHHREQLQDDRGRDVRHDARARTRSGAAGCPPEKRSTMPSSVPCTWLKNSASAAASMPGVGHVRAQPVGGEQHQGHEHAALELRNLEDVLEALQAFDHLAALATLAGQDSTRRPPPRSSAWPTRSTLCACTVRAWADAPSPSTLTAPRARLADEPARDQRVRIDHAARREARGEIAHVHDRELGLASVGQEAALGQPPVERHLTALEPGPDAAAGPRLLALVALARGLAVTGPRPAAYPLAASCVEPGAGRRSSSLIDSSHLASRERDALAIMPRIVGRVVVLHRSAGCGEGRALARWPPASGESPMMLLTSVTLSFFGTGRLLRRRRRAACAARA